MKTTAFFIGIFLLLSFSTAGQDINRLEFSESSNNMILIGSCSRDAFAMPEFQEWFDLNYEDYEPDQGVMEDLKTLPIKDITLKIIMGTWCSDSRREVPRFYKIMDDLGVTDDQVKLLMVNHDKKIPGMDIEDLNIERVPTLIFYKADINGAVKEMGRIIEIPIQSLEKDLLKILYKSL